MVSEEKSCQFVCHKKLEHKPYSRNMQAAQAVIEAVRTDIPKPDFVDLLAGFECFTRTGTALPDDTVRYV